MQRGAGPVWCCWEAKKQTRLPSSTLAWCHRRSAENFFPDNPRVQPKEELCLALMLLPLAAAAITPLRSGSRCCLRVRELAEARCWAAPQGRGAKPGCDQRVTAEGQRRLQGQSRWRAL